MVEDKLLCSSVGGPIHTGTKASDEPYILASLSRMVYYVDDLKERGWSIPIHIKPRDLYDMGNGLNYVSDSLQRQDFHVVEERRNLTLVRLGL